MAVLRGVRDSLAQRDGSASHAVLDDARAARIVNVGRVLSG